jgi:drug/metabolite transporter (DMT)-like permease
MISAAEIVSLVTVGALWGCTNPLLKKGSSQRRTTNPPSDTASSSTLTSDNNNTHSVFSSLSNFQRISVWLPYLVNQAGSLLYYFTLSQSDLSLAVPVCNALSLVFSIVTSYILGERVEQPFRTMIGAALVMGGAAACLVSRNEEEVMSEDESAGAAQAPQDYTHTKDEL